MRYGYLEWWEVWDQRCKEHKRKTKNAKKTGGLKWLRKEHQKKTVQEKAKEQIRDVGVVKQLLKQEKEDKKRRKNETKRST